MKKFLLVLGMVTCIFGMTACGQQDDAAEEVVQLDEDRAVAYADQLIEGMNGVVEEGSQEQYASEPIISAAISSWESALEEMGTYLGTTDYVITGEVDSATIEVTVDGSDHDAVVSVLLDADGNLVSVTTNVIKSFGELMVNAALNTLLGMGTVFIVLILISLLISCFKFIPAWQEKLSGKKKKTAAAPAPAPVAAAPVVEEAAAEEDDCELVAVIAAAIAASEGAQSTDGFVVRSIRRRGSKWQNA